MKPSACALAATRLTVPTAVAPMAARSRRPATEDHPDADGAGQAADHERVRPAPRLSVAAFEAGLNILTPERKPPLDHLGKDRMGQWLLVCLEGPKNGQK